MRTNSFPKAIFKSCEIIGITDTENTKQHNRRKTDFNMAQQPLDTSAKHADPYKEANLDNEVSLEQKIHDLSNFISHCKFGMMTTHDATSGNLVSRCMALAAQVS